VIVDDDQPLLTALVRVLPDYQIRTFRDPGAALAAVLADPDFDMILCDLMMGATTGIDFYLQLEAGAPALVRKLVFMSGGGATPSMQQFLDGVPNPMLAKPFSAAAVHALVQERVDGSRSVIAPPA